MKNLAVNTGDNPHACIVDEDEQCLACALIEAMGEERRDEALAIAAKVAEEKLLSTINTPEVAEDVLAAAKASESIPPPPRSVRRLRARTVVGPLPVRSRMVGGRCRGRPRRRRLRLRAGLRGRRRLPQRLNHQPRIERKKIMCMCEKPTRNDEDPRWNLNNRAPELQDGDQLIYDECGRCKPDVGGIVRIDHHSHHFRLVENHGLTVLLVRHGGGDERINLGYRHARIPELLRPMDSDRRYLMLHALYDTHKDAARQARELEAFYWRKAAAEKRIKTRKMPRQNAVKVWIEPEKKEDQDHA